MNLWDSLEKIRNRPVQEKRLLSFFIAAGMTAVIAISWATVGIGGAKEEKQEITEDRSSPFAAIGAQFKILKSEFSTIRKDTAPVMDDIGELKDELVDIVKNGTSSSSTLKYLQLDSFEESATSSGEIIIEAEVEELETGTSTQEIETGEIEQSN